MKLFQSVIPDVVLIHSEVFQDARGWFMESFNQEVFNQELLALGLPTPGNFVQDNLSCSKKGVLRGLHYQRSPHAQGKLVRVLSGSIFDVAVDLRENSDSFGAYVSFELSETNKHMVWIPEGFAHGFVAMEDNTHVLYKTTDFYRSEYESSVFWDDPTLNIDWPLRDEVLISLKDQAAQLFLSDPLKIFH